MVDTNQPGGGCCGGGRKAAQGQIPQPASGAAQEEGCGCSHPPAAASKDEGTTGFGVSSNGCCGGTTGSRGVAAASQVEQCSHAKEGSVS
jgi:hypothetical protein